MPKRPNKPNNEVKDNKAINCMPLDLDSIIEAINRILERIENKLFR